MTTMPATGTVTVFGSLHYDIMVDAPDRPRKGETVAGSAWFPKFGGKGGNQAVAAARAGAITRMIGAVGDDDFGRLLVGHLAANGVDTRLVGVRAGAGTGLSVAIFDATGDYGAVIVSGSNLLLGQVDVDTVDFSATAVLVLQNEVPEEANLAAAGAAKAAGTLVVLNAAPARNLSIELDGLVDILVVNAVEAAMLLGGAPVDTLEEALQAARDLARRFAAVIVTAGGEGLAFAGRAGAALSMAAIPVKVESTHGAGDEFVGVLAAHLARGVAIRQALDAANQAAARLVATPESQRGSVSVATT